MPITYYVVVPFDRDDAGNLTPGAPQELPHGASARISSRLIFYRNLGKPARRWSPLRDDIGGIMLAPFVRSHRKHNRDEHTLPAKALISIEGGAGTIPPAKP